VSSLRRVISSRANGARSRGPKTPEGKKRSSRNAYRHGLLAKTVIIGSESAANFRSLVAQHEEHFGPLDGVELGLLEEMASAYWRMRRSWAIEKEWLEQNLQAQDSPNEVTRIAKAFGDLAETKKLSLLHRYESRMHRIYQRSIKTLLLLQSKNDQTNPVPKSDTPFPNEPEPQPS
jgi:hypothetical protein